MESLNKVDDIIRISKKMGIPKEWVKSIVNSYITYVYNKVINGETVSFLRICDFRTKGYIGNKVKIGIEETYGNRLVITSSRSYTLKGVPNLVLSVRGSFKRKVGV